MAAQDRPSYRTLGYSSKAFRKTRFELYDLQEVTDCCNYAGVDIAHNNMMRALRKTMLSEGTEKANGLYKIPVKSTMPECGVGRYTPKVPGCTVTVVGWDPDENPIFQGRGTYIATMAPMLLEYRSHVSSKRLIDIDFDNCHPRVAKQEFASCGLESPILDTYIADKNAWRDGFARDLGVSSKAMKTLLIKTMNEGSIKKWCADQNVPVSAVPSQIFEFKREMIANRDVVLEQKYSEFRDQQLRKGKTMRSIWASVLQDIERRLMECCVLYFEKNKFVVPAHIYDGFTVKAPSVPEEMLEQAAAYAESEVGIRMKLEIKPWASTPIAFVSKDLIELTDLYDEAVETPQEYQLLSLECKPNAKHFDPLKAAGLLNDIVCVDVNAKDFFVCRQGIWKPMNVSAVAGVVRQRMQSLDVELADCWTSPRHMEDFIGCVQVDMYDSKFMERLDVLPRGRLPFANGMYNALDDSFTPGFKPEDMVTKHMSYDYDADSDVSPWVEYYTMMFPHEDRRRFVSWFMGRALYHRASPKFFLMMVDIAMAEVDKLLREGNTGKSKMLDRFIEVFDIFTLGRQKDAWCVNKNKNPNAHRANEFADRGSLLKCQDETSKHSQLDMELIRSDAGGDTTAKSSLRNASANDMASFVPIFSPVLIANGKQISAALQAADVDSDDGAKDRLAIIKLEARFLKPSKYGQAMSKKLPNVFPSSESYIKSLQGKQSGHAKYLAQCYREFIAAGGDDTWELPDCVVSDLSLLLKPSDECTEEIKEYLAEKCAATDLIVTSSENPISTAVANAVMSLRELKANVRQHLSTLSHIPKNILREKEFEKRILAALVDIFPACKFEERWKYYELDAENNIVRSELRGKILGVTWNDTV